MRKILFVLWVTLAARADAFCGFYVAGSDAKLFNNASLVVMMREGTRTVLSMQNNYQGPPAGFAMVVPVPVVLQKENVKTLPREVFTHVEQLAGPRLVEYWEQDPCAVRAWAVDEKVLAPSRQVAAGREPRDLGVKVEAQFTVGEYEIVILSAQDSTGLDTWIRREGYKIPEGAEPFLRPYVAAGSKFFVAKVDVTKVAMEGDQAMLSPLRFHYDTQAFALPVRLGLMNAKGAQDLIVNILARGKRYEVANYPNVTIPTNIDVADETRTRFAAFYAALFDATLEKHKRAVVTEYAWDAGTCDPCPTPPLQGSELATLGADVLPQRGDLDYGGGFVLTRLHARYTRDTLGDDLVFREAKPIVGGREMQGPQGQIEKGAQPSGYNNFQARYVIRHEWQGPTACKEPTFGVWGGPPRGEPGNVQPRAATGLAFADRGLRLASYVTKEVPELGVKPEPRGGGAQAGVSSQGDSQRIDTSQRRDEYGGRICGTAGGWDSGAWLGLSFLALLVTRRRRCGGC